MWGSLDVISASASIHCNMTFVNDVESLTNNHSKSFLERCHRSLPIRHRRDIIDGHAAVALLKVDISLLRHASESAVPCAKVKYGSPVVAIYVNFHLDCLGQYDQRT